MNRLLEMEEALIAEARQWAQARMTERLQAEADACASVCPRTGEPLSDVRFRAIELRTACGPVKLRVRHGYSRALEAWVCPVHPEVVGD